MLIAGCHNRNCLDKYKVCNATGFMLKTHLMTLQIYDTVIETLVSRLQINVGSKKKSKVLGEINQIQIFKKSGFKQNSFISA